ncbi:hypothetical protein [uncultured Roseibium sp.]|uniref:hypothetical protein n=1 Tax=uncultured Roseibium sp. TaxID=1936171 RepID=UPI00261ADA54|nr:hypothetical protein [uncultured Roseibium sp.]
MHRPPASSSFLFPFAHLFVWAGYIVPIFIGISLWPQLFDWGIKIQNQQLGFALILVWGCLPITILIGYIAGIFLMHVAAAIDPSIAAVRMRQMVGTANVLGVVATIGSCGMIASGFEPPEPIMSLYDIRK